MPAPSSRPDTQRAVVAQQEALVNADQAAIDNAQATLSYTKIIAPLSGRAGLRQVDQGNIIHAADTHRPRHHHPIAADRGAVQPAAATDRAGQRRIRQGVLAVDVFGNDGVTVVDTGKLTGIDNQVESDPPVRSSSRAEFPHARFQLWPGNSSMCGSRSKRFRRRW